MKQVAVVGAGPGGLCIAIALAKRDYQIVVFEKLLSPQERENVRYDKTYPVDITAHGMQAIYHLGIYECMSKYMYNFEAGVNSFFTEPMMGFIGSRDDITSGMLDFIKANSSSWGSNITIFFSRSCVDINLSDSSLQLEDGEILCNFDLIIAADGINSIVRERILATNQDKDFIVYRNNDHLEYLTVLHLANATFSTGTLNLLSFKPFTNAAMMPNAVGAMCVFQHSSPPPFFSSVEDLSEWLDSIYPSLSAMATKEALEAYLSRDAYLAGQCISANKCHAGNNVVFIGDAICNFPPRGMGVNIALESAMILDQTLAQHNDDIPLAMQVYSQTRTPELQAVLDLACCSAVENVLYFVCK